jgi:cytochrome c5
MRAVPCLVTAALLAAVFAMPVASAAPPRIASIDLPFDDTPFPDLPAGGASATAINENCRACHSAAMVLTQPKLSRAEWTGEVAKMRSVYKAPVAPADDAAIIDWLVAWSAQSAG